MEPDVIAPLREICLRLPTANERITHGEPGFFVRDKKLFCAVDSHHHGAEHIGFWCPAPPGVQEEMIAEDPRRFFRPPYVGPSGWLGVRLDGPDVPEPDWIEITEIVRDAYRKVAPKFLVAEMVRELDDGPSA